MTNKDITNSRSNDLPQTQRAAQYSSKTNSVSVNTTPLPTPSKDQLLIKVASASLCHSDLILLEPNETRLLLCDGRPIKTGHEATGIIISVPDTCTDPSLKLGQDLAFFAQRTCVMSVVGARSIIV
jgi:propanol-preferring alcohol dehydrogenase